MSDEPLSFTNIMVALADIDYNERSGIITLKALETLERVGYAYLQMTEHLDESQAWERFHEEGQER